MATEKIRSEDFQNITITNDIDVEACAHGSDDSYDRSIKSRVE